MARRQLPLFPSSPTRPEDISRQTTIRATLELFSAYLIQEGKSPHTVKAFLADLNLLIEYSGENVSVGYHTTTSLNRFLDWMERGRGVPCSRKTYARRVTTLKVYYKWLDELDIVKDNAAKAILQRSGPAPLSHVLSPKEIRRIFKYARRLKRQKEDGQDYRPELLFWLLLDTGIKKNEAMALSLKQVERKGSRAAILIKYKSRNVFKERRIKVDSDWVKLLDLYCEQYGIEDKLFTCTARNLEYILTDMGQGVEVPFKLSFEVMRWTCAVQDFRKGMDENQIREKLGLSETSWYETGRKIRVLADQLSQTVK
ncbi:hypothetical protein MASR2M15_26570 [Anaerolineales bacterium]